MTHQNDFKKLIRQRMEKTGESYTTARRNLLREHPKGTGAEQKVDMGPIDAVVLKVNRASARLRILDEPGQVTVRSRDVRKIVPGQIVTVQLEKRWEWRGDDYASGRIGNPRIDAARLGVTPLRLNGGELHDVAAYVDGYESPDPYASLWRRFTTKPRPMYEFEGVAWGRPTEGGSLDDCDFEDDPTIVAAELAEAGDHESAREVLMDHLATDIRCLDAHAQLGNMVFDRWPEKAILHYEVGICIGELSLPEGFDGLLIWGEIYNRPFLRCLHGYGLCCWRLSRFDEALAVFERILSLNPHDNQGARFCWDDVRQGMSWAEAQKRDEDAEREQLARIERNRQLRAQHESGPLFDFPNVQNVYIYPKPVPLNWGEQKLGQIARDEMGIDPETGAVFLFFNKKRDQMKLFFLDGTGAQQFHKWLPNGGFMLPVAREGERFIKFSAAKLGSLFRV